MRGTTVKLKIYILVVVNEDAQLEREIIVHNFLCTTRFGTALLCTILLY